MKKLVATFMSRVQRFIAVNRSRSIPADEKPAKKEKEIKPAGETVPNLSLTDYVQHFKTLLDPNNLVKKVTLLPEGMMTEGGVREYDDPVLGKVANARIRTMSWLEADGTGKLKSKKLGSNGLMRESWQSMKEKIEARVGEMREVYTEDCVKAGYSRESLPVNPSFDLTDVADWSQLTGGTATKNMPFPPGPFSKQMYLQDRWKMDSLAFQFYNYCGPAKRVIDLKVDFILGNGVKVMFTEDDNLQAGWDKFEDKTGFHITHQRWVKSLRKYGNLFIQPMTETIEPVDVPLKKKREKAASNEPLPETDPVTEILNVRSVDSSTIWDYVTNPEDIYEIYGYWVQFTTQYQLYTKGTEGPEQKYTEYVMRMMPPDSIIHIKTNCDENEKFGRSDLLAAMPYFSYNDSYLHALVQRAIMEACYVWDVEVQTGDDADVQREANKEGNFPPPGSSYFHNSSIKRNLVGFNGAAASGSQTRGEDIITQVAMATGVPKEFLGEAGHANKASALTATAPFTKHVQSCQKEDEVMMRQLVRFYCEANGRPDARFEIIYPEIAPADMLPKIQALVLAETQEYYSKERAATMVAKELNDTTYDYEQEKKMIDEEKKSDPMMTSMFGQSHQPVPGQAPGTMPLKPTPSAPMPPKLPGSGILGKGAGSPSEGVVGPPGAADQLGGTGMGK